MSNSGFLRSTCAVAAAIVALAWAALVPVSQDVHAQAASAANSVSNIQTTERNGNVVAIRCVNDPDSVMFISQGGMLVRVSAKSIRQVGRNTQGVRLVNLKEGDKLIAAARVADATGGEGDGEASPSEMPTNDLPPEATPASE